MIFSIHSPLCGTKKLLNYFSEFYDEQSKWKTVCNERARRGTGPHQDHNNICEQPHIGKLRSACPFGTRLAEHRNLCAAGPQFPFVLNSLFSSKMCGAAPFHDTDGEVLIGLLCRCSIFRATYASARDESQQISCASSVGILRCGRSAVAL